MAIIVTTYKELEFYIKMFRDGNADLLILESKGGFGKSSLVDEIMKTTRHLKVSAHTTPLQFFILGYEYKDCHIVLDDVDSLIINKDNIALLKQFAETKQVKEIMWNTTSQILADTEIPQKYETRSRALIICNYFSVVNKNVSSLSDRGFHLIFKPSKEEVINKIKEISKSYRDIETSEIIDLIEKYSKFADISLRTFVKGIFLYKQDKENYKERLLQEMQINPKLVLLDKLLQQYPTDIERLERWNELGYSRATYYRYKQSLKVSSYIENTRLYDFSVASAGIVNVKSKAASSNESTSPSSIF